MKKVNFIIILLYINNLILITANLLPIIGLIDSIDTTAFYNKLFEILFLWLIVFLIVSIINVRNVILDYRNNESDKLLKKMKRIKLSLIPFWAINFICYIPISALLLVVGHGFGLFIVPMFVVISYVVLIITSIFSISYLLRLRKNKLITNKQSIIHSILQLCFVIDVIDAIYIIIRFGKAHTYNTQDKA